MTQVHLSSRKANEAKIYVIHENDTWLIPLRAAFEELGLPYEEWFINEGTLNLSEIPPQGVFYNRMSASSHTRDHRYAVELTEPTLAWLGAHGRRVLNNRRAVQLEVRKAEQYLALQQYGIRTPRTIIANGQQQLLNAVKQFNQLPFVIKPNRGGKGLGVQLFHTIEQFEQALENYTEWSSLDGINMVQQYIKPHDSRIVRAEFIGGKFYYAVSVDASGGFQLCPADSCQVGTAFCPVGGENNAPKAKFEIVENYHNPDIVKYEQFLAANGIEIGAVEYVTDENGNRYVYDVNTNTNYNAAAEGRSNLAVSGMKQIARILGQELAKLQRKALKRSKLKLVV